MRWTTGTSPKGAEEVDFDDLFRSVWPRAVLTARRIVGPGDDAESLAAEALTRAYDRWPSVRRHPAPEAWVLRVTINLALDRVRRQSHQADGAMIDLRDGAGVSGFVVESFDEATAVRLALCAALRQLPDRQRHAVALRYLGGCVEEDIAASMKISPGSVKTHLKRGLERLRAQDGSDPEANLALAP
jgi:RNA polymerase sigma factor (sigma-70 family)